MLFMRLRNMHSKLDSPEPTFSSTSIVGIETHLSQASRRDVFDLMEFLLSAEAPGATQRADMGCLFLRVFLVIYTCGWLCTWDCSLWDLRLWK